MKETCQAFVLWQLQALQNASELQDLRQKKWVFNSSLHPYLNTYFVDEHAEKVEKISKEREFSIHESGCHLPL